MNARIYPAMIFLALSGSLMAGDNGKPNDVYQEIRELSRNTVNSLMPSCHFSQATTAIAEYPGSLSDYSCGAELTNLITALDPIIDKCVRNHSASQSCIALGTEYRRLLREQAERGYLLTRNDY